MKNISQIISANIVEVMQRSSTIEHIFTVREKLVPKVSMCGAFARLKLKEIYLSYSQLQESLLKLFW